MLLKIVFMDKKLVSCRCDFPGNASNVPCRRQSGRMSKSEKSYQNHKETLLWRISLIFHDFDSFSRVFRFGNVFSRLKTCLIISRHPCARLEVVCERLQSRAAPHQLEMSDFRTISEAGSGKWIINTVKYCNNIIIIVRD